MFLLLTAVAGGCIEKLALTEFDAARISTASSDTAYIEIVPPFQGFNEPHGLLVGNDQLMYVCDTRNDQIVQMDQSGAVLGKRALVRPWAVSQDRRLDLLVTGIDVVANGSVFDSVAAIFRIKMVAASQRIQDAVIDTIWRENARPRRRFVGIAAAPDNEFLVVRQGPDNSSFVDPDSRLLRFAANNAFITPVGDLVTRVGTGITDINQVTGLCLLPNSKNLILLQRSDGVAYGAIQLVYQSSSEFEGWVPKYNPEIQSQRSIDFIRPNRYVDPEGVVVDPRRGDIFIADAAQDSVFKFDAKGTFKRESFGFSKTGRRLLRPSGVAFFDKTLYVVDAQADCIFRFKLSTDF